MLKFDVDNIAESFEDLIFERGRMLRRLGGVEAIAMSPDEGAVTYRVRDALNGRLYTGALSARRYARGGPVLSSTCTCGERDCAHGCACAFAAIDPRTKWSATPVAMGEMQDRALEAWFSRQNAQPAQPGEPLSFFIKLRPGTADPVQVTAGVYGMLKSGAPGTVKETPLDLEHLMRDTSAQGSLLSLLALSGLGAVREPQNYYRQPANVRRRTIDPAMAATALEAIVATGRAHIDGPARPPLERRDLLSGHLTWQRNDGGQLVLRLEEHPDVMLVPSAPLWGIDPHANTAGPVTTGLRADVASRAVTLPALTDAQARKIHRVWHRYFATEDLAPPPSGLEIEHRTVAPVPSLVVGKLAKGRAYSSEPIGAELSFRYETQKVRPHDEATEFEYEVDGQVVVVPRDREAERLYEAELERRRLRPAEKCGIWGETEGVYAFELGRTDDAVERWLQFVAKDVPELRAAGWRVVTTHLPFEILEGGEWHVEVKPTDNQWFDVELGVDVDGKRIALMPAMLEAIKRARIRTTEQLGAYLDETNGLLVPTAGSSYVTIPKERVMSMFGTIVELFDDPPASKAGNLRLSRAQLASMNADDEFALQWPGTAAMAPLLAFLRDPQSAARALAVPRTFSGSLRSYQRVAVAWLQVLRECGFGGILADEMGLGKSVMLAAHLAVEKSAGRLERPGLIVVKTNGLAHWVRILEQFVPSLSVNEFTGADRHEDVERLHEFDIVLTTHASFTRSIEQLAPLRWHIAAIDEAQAMKNNASLLYQAARSIAANQTIALTGTPVENTLLDLHSIASVAVPGLLGDRKRFVRLYRTPIEKGEDGERAAALSRRAGPFVLRRTKHDVAKELPPKSEIVNEVVLSGAQLDLYETIRVAMLERVREALRDKGLARSQIVVLDALLKLRQVCCDPRLVKLPSAKKVAESAKLAMLLDMLQELVADGRRILLFSQFTEMLDLIVPELHAQQLGFVEIRGSTRDRVTPKKRFDAGEVPLFLLSTKAGGTSLDLITADTVILYDPWWNPAVEDQAADRAHRLGQTKNVFVYKLITVGTVEERMVAMQQRKARIAKQFFSAGGSIANLSEGDIENLFAPLG